MNVENLEEKKLVFGGDVFIYWTITIDDRVYTITAFNMMSLYMYIGRDDSVDSILFPKLYPEDNDSFKELFNTAMEILIHSAKTYSGDVSGFTAYFLLQAANDNNHLIEQYKKNGLSIEFIDQTVVSGMRFDKYSININPRELGD